MSLYENLLKDEEYLKIVRKIESMRFITDGKWDWEHGLGHYQRVSEYTKEILCQLGADSRTIDLAMIASLLHDIGLSKGDKVNHAVESSKMASSFIEKMSVTNQEKEMLYQAILDHSKGENISSLVGLSLVLADKLDVTYHRTEHSSIQDKMNKEIQKIKRVGIKITDSELIVTYDTDSDFDIDVLQGWKKAITIPKKVSEYLGKKFTFVINGNEVNYEDVLAQKSYIKK